MTLTETIAENRKSLRAAIVAVPFIGASQRALILQLVDRHFELQAAIVARLDTLEKKHGHDPEG